MDYKVQGNIKSFLGMHGSIEKPEKGIEALAYMSELNEIDIDAVNKASEQGGIYVTAQGRIIRSFTKFDDTVAKYKVVPTGIKLRYSNYPLLASFIKVNNFWEGVYIGTANQLFTMYEEHCSNEFSSDYKKYFSDDNRTVDIIGFGLDAVLDNNKSKDSEEAVTVTVIEDSDKAISELELALQKLNKTIDSNSSSNAESTRTTGKKKAHLSKADKKRLRLEAHLEKMKQKQEQKQALEEAAKKEADNQKAEENILEVITTTEQSNNEQSVIEQGVEQSEKTGEKTGEIECNTEQNVDNTEVTVEQVVGTESSIGSLAEKTTSDTIEKAIDKIVEQLVTEPITHQQTEQHTESEQIAEQAEQQEQQAEEQIEQDINIEDSDTTEQHHTETHLVIKLSEENKKMQLDLFKSMDCDFCNFGESEKDKYKMQLKLDLIDDIYERLLIKEHWKTTSKTNNNKNRLGFYLKAVCLVIWRDITKTKQIKGKGYVLSNDGKHMIINTGLLDKYGNYIYLLDSTPMVIDFYDKKVFIVNTKASLFEFNFSAEYIKNLPEPISVVDDKSKLVFNASIKDIDLNDTLHLAHIILDRIDRFPKKFRSESPLNLAMRVKEAISRAVLISKNDCRYIVPKYDFSHDDIQFLIPFHLETNIESRPELAIVIGKNGSMWTVYTVLYTDDAYDDARLISRPSESWIKNN